MRVRHILEANSIQIFHNKNLKFFSLISFWECHATYNVLYKLILVYFCVILLDFIRFWIKWWSSLDWQIFNLRVVFFTGGAGYRETAKIRARCSQAYFRFGSNFAETLLSDSDILAVLFVKFSFYYFLCNVGFLKSFSWCFYYCCNLKLQFGPIFEILTFDFGVKFVNFPENRCFLNRQYLKIH